MRVWLDVELENEGVVGWHGRDGGIRGNEGWWDGKRGGGRG